MTSYQRIRQVRTPRSRQGQSILILNTDSLTGLVPTILKIKTH